MADEVAKIRREVEVLRDRIDWIEDLLDRRDRGNALKKSFDIQLQRAFEKGHNHYVALVHPNSWSAFTLLFPYGVASSGTDRDSSGKTMRIHTDYGIVVALEQDHRSDTKITIRSWRG